MSYLSLEDKGKYRRILVHKNLITQLKILKKNPMFRNKTMAELTKYVIIDVNYSKLKKNIEALRKSIEF